MTDSVPTDAAARIARELAESGWSVCADFLPAAHVHALAAELRERFTHGEFRAAGVGSGQRHRLQPELRGDQVHWLDEHAQTTAQAAYFSALEDLRCAINRELFLGLFRFEGHMAVYPPGSFYRRHLDQFQYDGQRKVSAILYLNPDWRELDGGQLRIYLDDTADAPYADIAPRGGTLVCFLSERFYHEVLPATRERLSLTGWFRVRD